MYRFFIYASWCLLAGYCTKLPKVKPIESANKVFFGEPQVTVSKFPPVVEFLVQKIQSQYSNYAHEDLSRPPTWDKPVYTLSPQDQLIFTTPAATLNITKGKGPRNRTEVVANPSLNDIELIPEATPTNFTNDEPMKNTTNFEDFSYEDLVNTTEKLFEIINPTYTVNTFNKSVVHITPRPKTTTGYYGTVDEFSPLDLNLTLVDVDKDNLQRRS